VKSRFQSLAFKCDLQRYNAADRPARVTRQQHVLRVKAAATRKTRDDGGGDDDEKNLGATMNERDDEMRERTTEFSFYKKT
jgi:hypothetical protein